MKVTVRNLKAEEWHLWRDLRLRALTDSPNAFRATLEQELDQPDDWWDEIVGSTVEHPRGGLWVAECDGRAVGMLFGRLGPDSRVVEVGAMWVAPRFREWGAGTRMLEAAMAWAREAGASRAELWVTEGNDAALSLYRKLGFRPTADSEPLREGSHLRVRKLAADFA